MFVQKKNYVLYIQYIADRNRKKSFHILYILHIIWKKSSKLIQNNVLRHFKASDLLKNFAEQIWVYIEEFMLTY